MTAIIVLNLLMTIGLGILGLTLYSEIDHLLHKLLKAEAEIKNIRKLQEADKLNLIETWNHAERAVLRTESNARNLHDLETAVRKLQGWKE